MNTPTHIYEVIDHSNDEIYYTLAMFLSYEDAKNFITDNLNDEQEFSEHTDGDDCEIIKIKQIPIGGNNRKTIYTLERSLSYNKDRQCYLWKVTGEKSMTL